jgi:hypothetical protein
MIEARSTVNDSGSIQNLQHLNQGVVPVVQEVVIRQRNSVYAGSCEHGNVLCG